MKDVYEKLRKRLDDMSTGYPATESGVEMRILRRLFNEIDAEWFLKLTPFPETAQDAAERLGSDPNVVAEQLKRMVDKGLIFRLQRDGKTYYAAMPFLIGSYEFQVKSMDRELARDFDEYFEAGLGRSIQSTETSQMRTIPIKSELVGKWPVAAYEDAIRILEKQEKIAVVPCICRTESRLLDKGCDRPIESCLCFDDFAVFYVEKGMGHYISVEEARKIIKQSDEDGMVLQPNNSKEPIAICSCCGCCCAILKSLKKQPLPAASVLTNHFAQVDESECTACETCVGRCQMDAIEVKGEMVSIDLNRCIGCGLCVTSCPTEAIHLVRKSEGEVKTPPDSFAEVYMEIAQERGKNLLPEA